jgi:hypothetical protein
MTGELCAKAFDVYIRLHETNRLWTALAACLRATPSLQVSAVPAPVLAALAACLPRLMEAEVAPIWEHATASFVAELDRGSLLPEEPRKKSSKPSVSSPGLSPNTLHVLAIVLAQLLVHTPLAVSTAPTLFKLLGRLRVRGWGFPFLYIHHARTLNRSACRTSLASALKLMNMQRLR